MKFTKTVGAFLLGIWLVVTGLMQIVSISIPYSQFLLAALAIAAGVFMLFGR